MVDCRTPAPPPGARTAAGAATCVAPLSSFALSKYPPLPRVRATPGVVSVEIWSFGGVLGGGGGGRAVLKAPDFFCFAKDRP